VLDEQQYTQKRIKALATGLSGVFGSGNITFHSDICRKLSLAFCHQLHKPDDGCHQCDATKNQYLIDSQ